MDGIDLASTAVENIGECANTVNPIEVLLNFDFWVVALLDFAIVTAVKQAVRKALSVMHKLPENIDEIANYEYLSMSLEKKPTVLDDAWFKITLVFLPLVLGAGLGMTPYLFDEYPLHIKAFLGTIAGFLSPTLYNVFKRFAPNLLVSSKGE